MSYTKLYFNSKDGLKVTADFYKVDKSKGLILLCHRSHCNRGEYRQTAPKLNEIGYSCLAIDQRSGMKVWGETNETKNRAKELRLPTGYLHAKPDIEAAVEFAYNINNQQRIILLGSSYSAALALLISTETDKIKAAIAFSPGEYLKGIKLEDKLAAINKPTFVTSTKKEIQQVISITKNVSSGFLDHFVPKADGFHGSKTLWESIKGHETYWTALKNFLNTIQ